MRRTIVDAQVINELLARCPTTTVDPLDTLVHEGDLCESLMVVTAGSLLASVRIGDGLRIVGRLGIGDVIGEMPDRSGPARHLATVTAAQMSQVASLPADDIHDLIAYNPTLGEALEALFDVQRRRRMDALTAALDGAFVG
jgi:CRP-like cAMP-binding protein